MKRRDWLVASAALALTPRAQPQRLRRVAIASPGRPNPQQPSFLIPRMEELGWIEGRTIEYLRGYAHDDARRWEPMIAELLAWKPEVLVVVFTAMAQVAMKLTRDVPIVFAIASNPEKSGLVASLARPGGNVTGVSTRDAELIGKRIELVREITPGIRRIAMLANPDSPASTNFYLENYAAEARKFGIEVRPYDARSEAELLRAFDRLGSDRMQGLLNIADSFQLRARKELVAHAGRLRLTAIYTVNGFVEAGGLASFGTNVQDQFRRAADYVDKILRGAKPADLPVQEPTHFQLAINLKAAREQGLKFPQSILVRADQVIE